MAIPQMTEMPAYVVYRDIPAGEPFDPTSPLVFFPPKGSDELFDALRVAFPLVKSHSERMREAVIAFLLEERQHDQSQPSPAMTMDTMPTTWPSISSESESLLSTPETLNFATPASFTKSPQPYAPQLTRQASTATSSQPSPPSLDAMTGVFSLSTSAQPKQRVRRKMTEAEKVEYRKRRIVKACDKCAKRKRKCPHNQAEMATVPSNKSESKVSKSMTPPTKQWQTLSDNAFASVDDLNFDPTTLGPWEDFNMFEDPMAELNMEDFINFDQQQYGSDLFTPDVSPLQSGWDVRTHDDSALLFSSMPTTDRLEDRLHNGGRNGNGGRSGNGGGIGGSESPDLLKSSSASSDAWSSAGGYARQGNQLRDQQFLQNGGEACGGDGMLWEHLRNRRPEQPVPTHTAHVHDAEAAALSGLSDNIGGEQHTRRPPTPNAPHPRGDSADSAINRRSRPVSDIFDGAAYLENNLREAAVRASSRRPERQRREESPSSEESHETHVQIDGRDMIANPRAAFNTKQSRIHQSQGLPVGRGGFGNARGDIESTLTSTSVSVSDRSTRSAGSTQGRPEQAESPAGQKAARLRSPTQKRPAVLSLGEGLLSNADSSSKLYMARKRNGYKLKNGPTSPANGGACLQLEETKASPFNTTTIATKPGRTHTLAPSMYNFDGATDQYHDAETQAQAGPATAPKKPAAVDTTSLASPAHQERLHDRFRHRDHHGRTTASQGVNDHPDVSNAKAGANDGANDATSGHAQDLAAATPDRHRYELRPRPQNPSRAGECPWANAATATAVACCIAVFAGLLLACTETFSPTLLLLALVSPVQCTTKKSSWLKDVSLNKDDSAQKSLKAKDDGHETVRRVWLRGLMFPHEMAPLPAIRA